MRLISVAYVMNQTSAFPYLLIGNYLPMQNVKFIDNQ